VPLATVSLLAYGTRLETDVEGSNLGDQGVAPLPEGSALLDARWRGTRRSIGNQPGYDEERRYEGRPPG
jgi:hypothetical protein